MGPFEEVMEKLEKIEEKLDRPEAVGERETELAKGKFADKEGLNGKEVAEFLGIAPSTVHKHKDVIPHTKLGGRIIYPKTAVLDWLKENAEENTEKPSKREAEGAIIKKLTS